MEPIIVLVYKATPGALVLCLCHGDAKNPSSFCMRWPKMGALHLSDPKLSFPPSGRSHGPLMEEIDGLIRVYKDGHVDRLPAIAEVPCTSDLGTGVAARDVVIDHSTGIWARIYVPKLQGKLPLLVYFHGGGFCVGSAAWSCYHEFLLRLASTASCIVVSVNYRLAPEHRLPAAYEDGLTATRWLMRRQASGGGAPDEQGWWRSHANLARVFLAGDSAGAAIAFHAATQPGTHCIRGLVLIQPFFGGEARTSSERSSAQPSRSALTLATSDCYWRMALPPGASRDHPWCNPLAKGGPRQEDPSLPPAMVCVSELDILRDRNMELCRAMKAAGRSVDQAVYGGVGHAFQVLNNYQLSQARTQEMLSHIKAFINSK